MTHYELKKSLHEIIKNAPLVSIERDVIAEALAHEDAFRFFAELTRYGCESGLIASMIYHQDTHRFYDKHYHEIESLRLDWEGMSGNPMMIEGDLKNFYAWFSFQNVAFRIARDLELD